MKKSLIEKNLKFKRFEPYGKVTKRANIKWVYEGNEILQYVEEESRKGGLLGSKKVSIYV